ncbi:MAG: flagellar basal body P-ring protein FlgI [Pirellulales bacterium]
MKPYAAIIVGMLLLASGCSSSPTVRPQSPEELEQAGADTKLVGEFAVPHQMNAVRVEGIAMVTGLQGTGGDPPPSPQRSYLITEMQTRGVENPNQMLASGQTALVVVQGFLRAGIQKGDRFDIELHSPPQSETESLAGGWLMETRLKEMAVLDAQIREGSVKALAQGPLMVQPLKGDDTDAISQNKARILGGGVALVSRPLALLIKPQYKSVRFSAPVATAINRRFSTHESGVKTGVANARDDQFIEINVHPRYKDNIERYIRVVRAVAVRETSTERLARINLLERQLLDPVTSSTAAIRLEALGKEGIPALKKGLEASDREVRFYAAEALAYLDESDAAKPLADAARDEPAFRVFALAALSAMDDVSAYDQLRELLHVPSAETRYGAFRALWAMNPNDAVIRGEKFDDRFSYHVIDSDGPPMVHATRSYRPEIVLFGGDQVLKTPMTLEASKQLWVNSRGGDEVTVSRFAVGEQDQKRVVSNRLDDVLRAIVDVGGSYPEVVQFLQQAHESNNLDSRFEVDAIPEAGRIYYRDGHEPLEEVEGEEVEGEGPVQPDGGLVPDAPLPDLFDRRSAKLDNPARIPRQTDKKEDEEVPPKRPVRTFFAKMVGRGKE